MDDLVNRERIATDNSSSKSKDHGQWKESLVNQLNLVPPGSSQETNNGRLIWRLKLSSLDGLMLTGTP
jgi:hypothetical protein